MIVRHSYMENYKPCRLQKQRWSPLKNEAQVLIPTCARCSQYISLRITYLWDAISSSLSEATWFLHSWGVSRPCCWTVEISHHSCLKCCNLLLKYKLVTPSMIRQFFWCGHPQLFIKATFMILVSLRCTGYHQHNSASFIFMCCTIPKM